MVIIPSIAFLLAENSRFQTYISAKLLENLSTKVGSNVQVRKVRFTLFKDLILEDVLITDQELDTLAFIPKLRVDLDSINFQKRRLILKDVAIYNGSFNIQQFKDSTFNFQFLLDSLASPDSVKQVPWYISPGKLRLYKADLNLKTQHLPLNFNRDLHLNDVNLHLNVLNLEPDSMVFELNRFNFYDSNGYHLKSLKTDFTYTPNQLTVNEFSLKTDNSELIFQDIYIQGDSILKSKSNFAKANASYTIISSEIALHDLTFLHPNFKHSQYTVALSGGIQGKIQDLNLNNVRFAVEDIAYLDFSAKINNILEIDESFLFAEFNELHINSPKFTRMLKSLGIIKPRLFEKVNELGEIDFTGDITGLPGNYVAFGTFDTKLGVINTDISLESDYSQLLEFKGSVKTKSFNLSALAKNRTLFGEVAMDISVDGLIENDTFQGMTIDGFIETFEFKGYSYSNTDLHGYFGDNLFNGAASMNDPNLNFMFYGRVDFSQEMPILNFDADIRTARVGKLNLLNKFPMADLSCKFAANIEGNSFSTFDGEFSMHDLKFSNAKGNFDVDSVRVDFLPKEDVPSIKINSDLFNASIQGDYNFVALYNSIKDVADNYLPSINAKGDKVIAEYNNDFIFNAYIHPIDTIAYILGLPYYFYDGLRVNGLLNDSTDAFEVFVDVPLADLNGALVKDLEVKIQNKNKQRLKLNTKASEIILSQNRKIENFSIISSFYNDDIDLRVIWNNNDLITNSGNLSSNIHLSRDRHNSLITDAHFNPSSIILADSQWIIPESDIQIANKNLVFNNVKIYNNDHYFNIDGIASDDPKDSLTFSINNLEIAYIQKLLKPKKLTFSGFLYGNATVNGLLGKPLIKAAIDIDSLTFNETFFGDFNISSVWNNEAKWLDVHVLNTFGGKNPLIAEGIYAPEEDSININLTLNRLNAQFLRPFIDHILKDATALGSGKVKLLGKIGKPYFEGAVMLDSASVGIDYLKTRYSFNDSVRVNEDTIFFNQITFYDSDGNTGQFGGTLKHKSFKNMMVDLNLSTRNLNVLNLTKKDNDIFYGKLYGAGTVEVYGGNGDVTIEANVKSMPNSTFVLPITSNYTANENNFINYKSTVIEAPETRRYRKVINNDEIIEGNLNIIIGVKATPDVKVELIFDETVGDIIKGEGNGQLNFQYSTKGDFSLNGEYIIKKGDYLFTLQKLINKSFNIVEGGIIRWTGDPFEADIDLDAYYPTRAPLYDLMPNSPNAEDLKKRFPVQCHMMLTNDLMNPTINFDIKLPTADDETKRSVESIINSEDELNRQVLSLLVMNRFYTPDYMRNTQDANAVYSESQAAAVTASEFLSNQLSNWLSQISNEVDLGVHYRPGDNQITSTEVELALSSQLFNDRVEFNGNVGYRDTKNLTTANTPSNFVGDFEVFVKLNQQYRLKAYSRTNDNIYYETSPTTQGIGIIYREEFDNLQDLAEMQRKRKVERKKKRKEKRTQKKNPIEAVEVNQEEVITREATP